MNYATIENEKVTNVIVADKPFAESIGAMRCDGLLVEIGDGFRDGKFEKMVVDYDEQGQPAGEHVEYYDVPSDEPISLSSEELREQSYETMTMQEDDTALIEWQGKALAVDQANKLWVDYAAEGNPIAGEIQMLIATAKEYIRALYPDEGGQNEPLDITVNSSGGGGR